MGTVRAPRPEYVRLERDICERYPDLHLAVSPGPLMFRGTFPVIDAGGVVDRFTIEMSFPEGVNRPPTIRETGGRIPRTVDRHVFPHSGAICTDVPELTLLAGKFSLLSYLEGPVHNYFLGQSLVERGKPWPFGKWSHGRTGLLEAYGELLGLDAQDENQIRRYLNCLAHKKVKGHWQCPCGSGKAIRQCHGDQVRRLHERIPPRIAQQARERLQMHP